MNKIQFGLPAPVPALTLKELDISLNSNICLMDFHLESKVRSFRQDLTYFGRVQLGPVDVIYYSGTGARWSRRNISHIRQDHADSFIAVIPIQAFLDVNQFGNSARAVPGSFIYMSTSMPFYSAISSTLHNNNFSLYVVRIPGARLRRHVPWMDNICNREIKIQVGATNIMAALIEQAITDGSALTESQACRFGEMIVDAFVNATLEAPELELFRSGLSMRQRTRDKTIEQAKVFIESNLSNTELDVRKVADHCRISSRYLQQVFTEYSITVGSYIRESRLARCRDELKNPILKNKSIAQIASRWGFEDAAYFAKVYKTKFGKKPSQDRCV